MAPLARPRCPIHVAFQAVRPIPQPAIAGRGARRRRPVPIGASENTGDFGGAAEPDSLNTPSRLSAHKANTRNPKPQVRDAHNPFKRLHNSPNFTARPHSEPGEPQIIFVLV